MPTRTRRSLNSRLRGGKKHFLIVSRRYVAVKPQTTACKRLRYLLAQARERGLGNRITIDLTLLRGLGYYTGLVFEGYVDELGFPLCGGGRYDDLLPSFGLASPAVGWSAGIERILIALERRTRR